MERRTLGARQPPASSSLRGRGAAENPPNRFEPLAYDDGAEYADPDPEDGAPPPFGAHQSHSP